MVSSRQSEILDFGFRIKGLGQKILARIFHDSAAPTADMTALPAVLGLEQYVAGLEALWLPGGTLFCTVSRHRIMKHPG